MCWSWIRTKANPQNPPFAGVVDDGPWHHMTMGMCPYKGTTGKGSGFPPYLIPHLISPLWMERPQSTHVEAEVGAIPT
jgi:hypothetical protein